MKKILFILILIFLTCDIAMSQVTIFVPDTLRGKVGETIQLPVKISELKSQKITAFELTLNYTTSVKILDYKISKITKALSHVDMNYLKSNSTIIAGYGSENLKGKGLFLTIDIKILKKGNSNIILDDFFLNSTQYEIDEITLIID